MSDAIERIKSHADALAEVPHNHQFRADLYELVAIAKREAVGPDFYGYVWDYDNPEDSNEDTFGEYLDNQCDQECGPILGMERRVMIARKLPDVLLTVTEVDEHNRPKSWSVSPIAAKAQEGK